MRNYRVTLTSSVGRLTHHVLADWYDSAQAKAKAWADTHPCHKTARPWRCIDVEVA